MAKKYREVRRALKAAGWEIARKRGSHEIWVHPDRPRHVTVAGKDSDHLAVGTLSSIRRTTGLENLR